MVNPGFAPDGRIHHRQQGGGHLDDLNASQPSRSRKTRHVSNNAAAEGHHQRAAFKFCAIGRIVNCCNGGRRLLVFAGINHQEFNTEACVLEAVQAGIAIGGGDIWVADHKHTPTRFDSRIQHLLAKRCQTAGSNHNVVGIALKSNTDVMQRGDCGHETVGTHLLSQ